MKKIPKFTTKNAKNSKKDLVLAACKCLFVIYALFAVKSFSAFGQLPTNNIAGANLAIMAQTNGVLAAPTNFFAANSNLLNSSIAPAAGAATLTSANIFSALPGNQFTNSTTHEGFVIANGRFQRWLNGALVSEMSTNGHYRTDVGKPTLTALGGLGNTNSGIIFSNAASGTNVVGFSIQGTNVANITGAGFVGPGSQLTGLNGSSISSGTVPDAQLSANVFLNNTGHFITGANTFIVSTGSGTLFINSNGVDNSITLQSLDPVHYSAARWIDNNGQEQGAVGYANTNSGFQANNNGISYNYLESYGGAHPFYFAEGGFPMGGMSSFNQYGDSACDFVWFDRTGSNVQFRVSQNSGIIASNLFTAEKSLTVVNDFTVNGSRWNTHNGTSNQIDASLIDHTTAIQVDHIRLNSLGAQAGPLSIDFTTIGSGFYANDFDLHLGVRGVQYMSWADPAGPSGNPIGIWTESGIPLGIGVKPRRNVSIDMESNIVSRTEVLAPHFGGQGTAPTIVTNSGAGTTTGTVYFTNSMAISDTSAQIVLNTGSSPATSSTIFTVTFGTAFTSNTPPNVVFSPANLNAAQLGSVSNVFVGSQATNKWTMSSSSTGLQGAKQYIWNCLVIQ